MATKDLRKIFFFIGGVIAIILAIIGAILPIVPTTPFIILAAYCFKNGSQKIHQWMIRQPLMGETIIDWENHRVIKKQYKILVVITILISFGSLIIFKNFHYLFKIFLAFLGIFVIHFVCKQNSYRKEINETN